MENFTPYSSLFGGMLIGLSATIFLLFNGRITGISGIMHGILNARGDDRLWRVLFLIGIIAGSACFHWFEADSFVARKEYPLLLLVIGGFLVGFGTRMGNGCTSGHAVCGIARLSIRSITATIVFMLSGFLTVYLVRHLL